MPDAIYATASEIREAGRDPRDINTGRTQEILRDSHGRTVPVGARVRLTYIRRRTYTVRWEKDSRTTIEIRNVPERMLSFQRRP